MTRFDRFERDLLRTIWFSCVYAFIVFTGFPLVLGFVSAFIFGFPTPSTIREILAYDIVFSLVIGVIGGLGEELLELKRDVEQLKLANSVESSRVVQPGG